MRREKEYKWAKFSPDVIREVVVVFDKTARLKKGDRTSLDLEVSLNGEMWRYDKEDEFFSDYRGSVVRASYIRYHHYGDRRKESVRLRIAYSARTDYTYSDISVEFSSRSNIQKVFEVFEKHYESSKIPEPPSTPKPKQKPKIFIGHGQNPQWKDLKDHLHEQHGYDIEAYEIGARAGHVIRDILEQMMKKSSFALLVMTAEDETAEGKMRPRQNVIHEAGLFQGKLGFHRAIILFEEGAEEFSNIQGLHQIRFSKGKIKETYGDVLATLKREFEE